MIVPFQIGFNYTFNTRAPAILGVLLKNVKVLGIVDYDIANTFINVEAMAVAVQPLLPAGTPSNPKTYQFIIFQSENGSKTVLAMQWVDTATIVTVSGITITAIINNADSADLVKIRDVLVAMGYTNLNLTSV